jgi:hypothetical protein
MSQKLFKYQEGFEDRDFSSFSKHFPLKAISAANLDFLFLSLKSLS